MKSLAGVLLLLLMNAIVSAAGGVLPGSGTSSDPYLIEDMADFNEFAGNPQDYWWWNTYTELTVDLDFSANSVYSQAPFGYLSDESYGLGPEPDPNDPLPPAPYNGYCGRFNGGGHVVSNVTIVSDSDNCGFIGYLRGGVSNLGVENITVVSSGDSCGGLVGNGRSSSISQCYATGLISGNDNIGGLVGYGSTVSISRSYSTGDITGKNKVGGLAGAYEWSWAENSYSTCSVSGIEDVGGLVGSCGEIKYCYCTGKVNGLNRVGAIAGKYSALPFGYITMGAPDSHIQESYYYELSGPMNDVGGIDFSAFSVGDDDSLWGRYSFGIALTRDDLVAASSFAGFDFAGDETDGDDDIWAIDSGSMPYLSWQDGAVVEVPDYLQEVTTTLSGSGSEADPFAISNVSDLLEFCSNSDLVDGYYCLTNDIDMRGVDLSEAGFADSYLVERDFDGHFSGNGYVIYYLSGDVWGLFSKNSGIVKDVVLNDVNINVYYGSGDIGCIAGRNLGSVSNCHVNGNIYYDSMADGLLNDQVDYIGGIVGQNDNYMDLCSSTGGIIVSCYAAEYYTGSICGHNAGEISECYAEMSVANTIPDGYEGMDVSGGFAGANSGEIANCYSTGAVVGGSTAGGFAGFNSGTIDKCYSTGQVSGGADETGGFAGTIIDILDIGTISNCFWDVEASEIGASGDDNQGAIGKTTDQMVDGVMYEDAGWVFDGDNEDIVWQATASYPELANISSEYSAHYFTIDKMNVTAGKGRGDSSDSIKIKSSSFNVLPSLFDGDFDFSIYSGEEMELVYTETINISLSDKEKCKIKNDTCVYSFDLARNTFDFTGKKIDLTGMKAPVTVVLNNDLISIQSTAYDGGAVDVINGKKSMPTMLLAGAEDNLTVDSINFKDSYKEYSDMLNVKGSIAVSDTDYDFTSGYIKVSYGDYIIILDAEDLKKIGKKNAFKYKGKFVSGETVTAKFDFDKCTYSISIKKAEIVSGYVGEIYLSEMVGMLVNTETDEVVIYYSDGTKDENAAGKLYGQLVIETNDREPEDPLYDFEDGWVKVSRYITDDASYNFSGNDYPIFTDEPEDNDDSSLVFGLKFGDFDESCVLE